jgi:hypothetical protein
VSHKLSTTAVLLGLTALASCRPDAVAYSSDTSSAPGSMVQLDAAPKVNALTSQPIMMNWEFVSVEKDGSEEHLYERFYADGTGQSSLELMLVGDGISTPNPPTADVAMLHHDRQIFLALYRNLSVTDAAMATDNYTWFETLGSHTIGGHTCTKYFLDSKFNIGDAELWIDDATNVILGWTLFDPKDNILQRLEASVVDYNPDLSQVQWAVPPIASQPYDPWTSNPQLGFKPHRLVYAGPGFDSTKQSMLLSQSLFPSVKNMHLNMLTDGLRTLFVAQQLPPEWAVQPKGFRMGNVSHARVGGVSVLEGLVSGRWVFAVGSLEFDDLLVIANALRRG